MLTVLKDGFVFEFAVSLTRATGALLCFCKGLPRTRARFAEDELYTDLWPASATGSSLPALPLLWQGFAVQ